MKRLQEPTDLSLGPEDTSSAVVEVPEQRASWWRRALAQGGLRLLAVPWIGVLVGIVVLGAVFNSSAPCRCFLSRGNLLTTAQEFSYVGIAALGGAMVIMTKGIDLSVGSNMSLSGLLAAAVMAHGHGTALGLLAGLGPIAKPQFSPVPDRRSQACGIDFVPRLRDGGFRADAFHSVTSGCRST